MLPTYWMNWAKTQGCFTTVKKPCTTDELVRVVRPPPLPLGAMREMHLPAK